MIQGSNTEAAAYAYELGEDVLATIGDAEIFDVDKGTCIEAPPRLRWVIGTVVDRRFGTDGATYTLRIANHWGGYMVAVAEFAIEGVA